MKKPLLVACAIMIAFVAGVVIGQRKIYKVEPLYGLTSISKAEYIEGEVVATIDLSVIRDSLLQSIWQSKVPVNKGTHHLRLENHPDLYVSYYGAFFFIENQVGVFMIDDQHKEGFEEYFEKLLVDVVFPWRLKNNRERARAPDAFSL